MNKIQYVAHGVKWFDKVNGNTYHSVRITRCADGAIIAAPFQYGYGDQWQWTAIEIMLNSSWLPSKYNKDNSYLFERENNYPISWNCRNGLKKECVANGTV